MNERATVDDPEVLIVGAGPSGAVAAFELARKDFKVVWLEQGDWNLPDDFMGDKPQWELARLKQWHPSPDTRSNEADYPINAENSPLEQLLLTASVAAAFSTPDTASAPFRQTSASRP